MATRRIPLLIVDEVGYVPFEAEPADLFLQLVCARYERACLIVPNNNRSAAGAGSSATTR